MAKNKKQITLTFENGTVTTNFDGVDNFTELLVGLAVLEGVIGGVMNADKETIRTAVNEIQDDLQAKMPEGAEDE